MAYVQVSQVVERCLVGTSLREGATGWMDAMNEHHRWIPLVLQHVCREERWLLALQLHEAAQRLLHRQNKWLTVSAASLLEDGQAYGDQVLQKYAGYTLYVEDFDILPEPRRLLFLAMLQRTTVFTQQALLLLMAWPESSTPDEETWLSTHAGFRLSLPPLHTRSADIDRLICRMASQIIKQENISHIEGFSLEAVAHIHRAVLQTSRDSHELFALLKLALLRANEQRLPLQDGYIVAWPTVRLLEDQWQYHSLQSSSVYDELLHYNFQDRLFSASLEQASCRSGFSQELLELECQLLQRMIDELPSHQRNYQGMTARLDQLLWVGMKLISNARTQAELRDYFGFGGRGKIPKATAKLKFDQYTLDHYGFRASDPQPWLDHTASHSALNRAEPLKSPIRAAPQEHIPNAAPAPTESISVSSVISEPMAHPESRDILQIDGELPETLFWRHQDLFTVLGADPLTTEQIACLMQVDPKKAQRDLQQLVALNMLCLRDQRYHLPSDDLYYKHVHSPLRFLEENMLRGLRHAMHTTEESVLDNLFLKLPGEGLPLLREDLFQPFIHQQLLPLADHLEHEEIFPDTYNKQMYSLCLIGTHRLSSQIHGRWPLEERVLHYFREASLQRADQQQRKQAICLQASLMLSPTQATEAFGLVHQLRKQVRQHLPQGRGNKPNFNITICFTQIPLHFYRDMTGSVSSDNRICSANKER